MARRGRPPNTRARQEQLLDALEALLARGVAWSEVSAALLAGQAGLHPNLVAYHVPQRRRLLVRLVERLAAQVEARARERVRAGRGPLARLLAWLDAHLALGRGARPRAVAVWVALGAEAARDPAVRRVYRAAVATRLDALTALCRACLRERGLPVRPARAQAAAFAAAIEGAYQLAVAAPGVLPRGFAAPTLRALARALYAARG